MQILVFYSDLARSEAVDDFVTKQVNDALDHVRNRVTRVEVYLQNLNGPKAGIDKRCTMEVRISGQQPWAVGHDADDVYDAIRAASGKLQRAVDNRLGRLSDRA